MKKLHVVSKLIARTILAMFCLTSNNVFADCDSTAGTHYPTITGPNYQGSSYTDSFDCAVNGTKQASLAEINERISLLPPKLNNRFYLRLGANAAAAGISGAKNKLQNNGSTTTPGTLLTSGNKVASNNFELALGYIWTDFAIDFEWLASSSVSYSSLIYNITPTFTINSNVKGDALLFNIYWIFQDLYNVKLYGDFIVGYSNNSSTSYIEAGSDTTFKWYHWAFGLGVGGRFNIWNKLYADVNGRYIYLGTTRLIAMSGTNYAYIKTQRTWMGAAVCLLWLF